MSRNISAAVLATTLLILHSKNKKPIKKLLVLKWRKFHAKLRNFQYYGLILVSYKKNVYATYKFISGTTSISKINPTKLKLKTMVTKTTLRLGGLWKGGDKISIESTSFIDKI